VKFHLTFAITLCVGAAHADSYVILARNSGQNMSNIVASVSAAGGVVRAAMPEIGVITADSNSAGFAAAVLKNSNVQSVAADPALNWGGPRTVVEASDVGSFGVNSEPFSGYQWNLRQIGADKTAANGIVGNHVVRARVAVLDEGVVCDHPDLAPNLNIGLSTSFVPGEGVCAVIPNHFNHGTHVAGIIAAAINNFGVQGVAPGAEIVAVKVLSEASGSGSFGGIIQGILYASGPAVHADVINMSLGATFDRINAGGGGAGPLISALNRAVDQATARGTLVVSAAGNEGVDLNSRLWAIPAQSGNGMAVSATGPVGLANFDRLASYSNYGQSVINLAAPGGDDTLYPNPAYVLDMVLSPGGFRIVNGVETFQYYFADGTSMAAPHVSGVAALIVGEYGHMKPAHLKAILQQSAVDILKPGADAGSGHGRVDAANAVLH
jgi:subtilisin family serine protease